MSLTVGPMPTSPAPSLSTEGDGGDVGGWEDVREEEGRVEGVTTAQLKLLHVEQEREGKYRCRVEYKKCVVFSHSASLSVLADGNFEMFLLIIRTICTLRGVFKNGAVYWVFVCLCVCVCVCLCV